MLSEQLPLPPDEQPQGNLRILSVEQRHERSGRVVMLLDAESMGETKTDLRKRQFTYQIRGVTDILIKPGSWLLSPREDLGIITDVEAATKNKSKKKRTTTVALRVKFEETGIIRLNESWTIFKKQPITHREMNRWEKRMTDGAKQYYRQVLPGVVDSILFSPSKGVNGEQVKKILNLREFILYHAIKMAKSKESVKLTSTHLVDATREILEPLEKG
ncbi:MAG: hypothetical protein ACFFCH_05685 [Promethearchaeota archaeon]